MSGIVEIKPYINYFPDIRTKTEHEQEEILKRAKWVVFNTLGLTGRAAFYWIVSALCYLLIAIPLGWMLIYFLGEYIPPRYATVVIAPLSLTFLIPATRLMMKRCYADILYRGLNHVLTVDAKKAAVAFPSAAQP